MAQPSNTASAALFGTFAGIGNTKSSVPSLPFAGSGGTGASYFTMYGQVRNAVEQRRHTVDRFHIEPAGGEQTTHSGNAAEMSGAGGTDAPDPHGCALRFRLRRVHVEAGRQVVERTKVGDPLAFNFCRADGGHCQRHVENAFLAARRSHFHNAETFV